VIARYWVFGLAVLAPLVAAALARAHGRPAWGLVVLGSVLCALLVVAIVRAAQAMGDEVGRVIPGRHR
jgi:hypothetical protein